MRGLTWKEAMLHAIDVWADAIPPLEEEPLVTWRNGFGVLRLGGLRV